MRQEKRLLLMYLPLLTLTVFTAGCFGGRKSVAQFNVPREAVLEQIRVVSRAPIQFSEVEVDEVTAKIITDETEAAISPAIKQIQGKVLSPDKYVSAEKKYGAEGYFDAATGQFSWAKFKKVLDTMGATAHLEIKYILGKGELRAQSGNTITTYSVPTLELSAVLYNCETGAVLWQSKYPISHLMYVGMFYRITGELKETDVKTIWKAQRKQFKSVWKSLGQDICALTPDKKCMKIKK